MRAGRYPRLAEQTREVDVVRRFALRKHLPVLKIEADMADWPFKGPLEVLTMVGGKVVERTGVTDRGSAVEKIKLTTSFAAYCGPTTSG